jgi:hypothetical protein
MPFCTAHNCKLEYTFDYIDSIVFKANSNMSFATSHLPREKPLLAFGAIIISFIWTYAKINIMFDIDRIKCLVLNQERVYIMGARVRQI